MFLSEKLQKNVLSIRDDRVPFLKRSRVLINWGSSSTFRNIPNCRIYNDPDNVRLASDKLLTFSQWRRFEVSLFREQFHYFHYLNRQEHFH